MTRGRSPGPTRGSSLPRDRSLPSAPGPSRNRHTAALAWLIGLELFSNWCETTYKEQRVYLIGWLAWGLLVYAAGLAIWTALDAWRQRDPDPA